MKQAEDECVAILLNGIPDVATVRRETLERVIRTAFKGGWESALIEQEPQQTKAVN